MDYKKYKFKRNVDMDAQLVYAAMQGMFEALAIRLFETPECLIQRLQKLLGNTEWELHGRRKP